jgi:hypothetical protein
MTLFESVIYVVLYGYAAFGFGYFIRKIGKTLQP